MSDMITGANSDKALGYAAGNDPAIGHLNGLLSGQTFDVTSGIVKYTYQADANLDGQVDLLDLVLLSANWQQVGQIWTDGDFNYDGVVDLLDLVLLAANWQKGVGSPISLSFSDAVSQMPELSGVTVVPEPGALALLGLGAMSLIGRRRRRH
jgi:hypothetical protein